MDYMTVSEAAEKWGLSKRQAQVLCSENRIPNIPKSGKSFAIPCDAEKPEDGGIKVMNTLDFLQSTIIVSLNYQIRTRRIQNEY